MRTMEPVIQRISMRSVITRCESKGFCAGREPLLGCPIREGIIEHVNSAANEGFLMELLHHVAYHFKNDLQILCSEEIGLTLVTICNWVEKWGPI
jgi:hypothetical protein